MALNLNYGAIGQLRGPFALGESFSFPNVKVRLGVCIGEKDFMKAGNPNDNNGYAIQINDQLIRLGRTYIYESTEDTDVTTLSFPQGAPASLIVDYEVIRV